MLAAIQITDGWKTVLASVGAMLILAGLDFTGAIFAKEWAERGRIPMFVLGLASFAILFVVYARILKVAELSTVTIGWVVFLQVGLIAIDALRYDVRLSTGKMVAIGAILVLQGYLVLAPNGEVSPKPTAQSAAPVSEIAHHLLIEQSQ
jgi:hypothetical protein